MHDAQRVRLGDRLARLEDEIHGVARAHGPLLLEERGEIAPFEVLHHEVGGARVERADVVDFHGVLAANLDRRSPFANEARNDVGVLRHLRVEELDRHLLVEMKVRRGHDGPHAADPQHALDAIFADEDLAGERDPRERLRRLRGGLAHTGKPEKTVVAGAPGVDAGWVTPTEDRWPAPSSMPRAEADPEVLVTRRQVGRDVHAPHLVAEDPPRAERE